jgi:hypothetical protein
VLLAGYLPFEDDNTASLYKKVLYTDGTTPLATQKPAPQLKCQHFYDIFLILLSVNRSQKLSLHAHLGFLLELRS